MTASTLNNNLFWVSFALYWLSVWSYDSEEGDDESPMSIKRKITEWSKFVTVVSAAIVAVVQVINSFAIPRFWVFVFCFAVLWIFVFLAVYYVSEKATPNVIKITIPANGWSFNAEDKTGYPWSVRIPDKRIKKSMMPSVIFSQDVLPLTKQVKFFSVAKTEDGGLLISSANTPKFEIPATLVLTNIKEL